MRARPPAWSACRAVIAVAALYALALQAVLGGFVAAQPSDAIHALCLPEAAAGDPAKAPVHAHQACCTLAQTAAPPVPPLVAATGVVWPVRSTMRVAWRAEIVAAPRAPPGISPSARAPPVV